MSGPNQLDLNIEQGRNDDIRNVEKFDDSELPVLRPNYERRAHAHHKDQFSACHAT